MSGFALRTSYKRDTFLQLYDYNYSHLYRYVNIIMEQISLHAATAADARVLAELTVQLYQSELPNLLRASRSAQFRFFRYLIEHEFACGVRGRYLALDASGTPVGTLSLRLANDPAPTQLPPRLLNVALETVGLADTLQLTGVALRGLISPEPSLRRGEGFIHSLVVREDRRGSGIGATMMQLLEKYACGIDLHTMLLRVVVGNSRAISFYQRLGYRVVDSPPPWAAWITLPVLLMRKDLRSGA